MGGGVAKEAASAPELFLHTGHWLGEEGSGPGGTSGSSVLYVGWEVCPPESPWGVAVSTGSPSPPGLHQALGGVAREVPVHA